MTDITQILVIVISILVALADIYIIPWIKSKISEEKLNQLMALVKLGVECAEQAMQDSTGAEKKAYVLEYLQSKGVTYDEATINAAIESAVLEMNNSLLKKEAQ